MINAIGLSRNALVPISPWRRRTASELWWCPAQNARDVLLTQIHHEERTTDRTCLLYKKDGALYFHAPCFDGIVSSVLAIDFLEVAHEWTFRAFHPVGYDLKTRWASYNLPEASVVVDFLYHPHALFWADHHPTTFVTSQFRDDYKKRGSRRWAYFDPQAPSCASLLWERLFSLEHYRNPRYTEMVHWADKIDSARYASVEEASPWTKTCASNQGNSQREQRP